MQSYSIRNPLQQPDALCAIKYLLMWWDFMRVCVDEIFFSKLMKYFSSSFLLNIFWCGRGGYMVFIKSVTSDKLWLAPDLLSGTLHTQTHTLLNITFLLRLSSGECTVQHVWIKKITKPNLFSNTWQEIFIWAKLPRDLKWLVRPSSGHTKIAIQESLRT